MGGFTLWRDFLLKLFPECFSSGVKQDFTVDLLIVDMMQFMAKFVRNQPQNAFIPRSVLTNIKDVVRFYMNNEEDGTRPRISKGFAFLFDTPLYTPRNKAQTQQTRDTGAQKRERPADPHVEEGVVDGEEEGGEPTLPSLLIDDCLLTEAQFATFLSLADVDAPLPPLLLMPDLVPEERVNLRGNTVWRSNSLRWQLSWMVTQSLIEALVVPRDKFMILDDAIVFERAKCDEIRQAMLSRHQFEGRSAYDKACLIGVLMARYQTQRALVYGDRQIKCFSATTIGEADVKIPQYIRLKDGKRRFLVVSQDTDLIFILLLHMKRLYTEWEELEGEEGGVPLSDLELWLDTQTPNDMAHGDRPANNRPYRYINVKQLYFRIVDWFQKDYPSVMHPIETLVSLVYTRTTDFTRGFHTFLDVTERVIWDTFSELHSPQKEFRTFSNTRKPRTGLFEMTGLLNPLSTAILVVRDRGNSLLYTFTLNEMQWERFLYLLCQLRLWGDRVTMDASEVRAEHIMAKPPRYVPEPEVLLPLANDLRKRVQKMREAPHLEQQEATDLLLEMQQQQKKASVVLNSRFKPQLSSSTPSTPFLTVAPERGKGRKPVTTPIDKLLKATIPEHYGIPTRMEMKTRIHRMRWMLEYAQNTAYAPVYGLCYNDCSPTDDTLSIYGWRAVEVPCDAQTLNSSYHLHVECAATDHGFPFRSYVTQETSNLC